MESKKISTEAAEHMEKSVHLLMGMMFDIGTSVQSKDWIDDMGGTNYLINVICRFFVTNIKIIENATNGRDVLSDLIEAVKEIYEQMPSMGDAACKMKM